MILPWQNRTGLGLKNSTVRSSLQSTFHWLCRLNDVLSSILQTKSTNKESESSGKLSTQTTDSLLTVSYSLVMSKCLTICHLNARIIFTYNLSLKLAKLSAVTDLYGFDIVCVNRNLFRFFCFK